MDDILFISSIDESVNKIQGQERLNITVFAIMIERAS
jgi:hypothetical protein